MSAKLSSERLGDIRLMYVKPEFLVEHHIVELLDHIAEVEGELDDAERAEDSANELISQYQHAKSELEAELAKVRHERDAWRRALNDCTPGGSEFANDPENCKEWVRKARQTQHETIIRFKEARDAAEAELAKVRQELWAAEMWLAELPDGMISSMRSICQAIDKGDLEKAKKCAEYCAESLAKMEVPPESESNNTGLAATRATPVEASAGVAQDLSEAVIMLRVLNEETVLAGYPAGDRTQTLANVRSMRAALRSRDEVVRELLEETQAQLRQPFGLRGWVGVRAAAERLEKIVEGK